MMKIYKTVDEYGLFKETTKLERGCWINLVKPTTQEINNLVNTIGVLEDFITYPLDQEERARIDVEDDQTLILIDIPVAEKSDAGISGFSTIPLGMIVVRDDYFITVCTQETPVINDFVDCRVKGFFTFKKTRFVLQILLRIATYYLRYLKHINRETDKAEHKLQKTMSNKSLSLDALKMHLFDALEGVKNLSDPNASEADKTSIDQAKAIVDLSGKVIDICKLQVEAIKTLNTMDNIGSLRVMASNLGVTDEDTIKMVEKQN